MLGPSGSGKTSCLRLVAGFDAPDRGQVLLDGAGRFVGAAVRPQRQHGLPGLRAVPAHDRAARTSRTVRACAASTRADARAARARDARAGAARRAGRAPARAAFRRPAAARRAGARAHQPSQGAAARRAARRARPQAARRNADRAQEPAEEARHHLRLRDARPGRGACRWPIASPCSTRARIEQLAAPRELYTRPATAFVARFVGSANVADAALAQTLAGVGAAVRDPRREHRGAGRERRRAARTRRPRRAPWSPCSTTAPPAAGR